MIQTITFSSPIKKWMIMSFVLLYVAACAPVNSQYGYNEPSDYRYNQYTNNRPLINKSQLGALAGATGGAILGSNIGKGKGQIAAIAVGTLVGAMMGQEVGASLDRADQMYMQRASMRSLESSPSGVASTWTNPDSGNSGSITPVRTYQDNGRYCREYNQSIKVGGRAQSGYGTACRMPDGSWEIQS